jgi:hypothetical protein
VSSPFSEKKYILYSGIRNLHFGDLGGSKGGDLPLNTPLPQTNGDVVIWYHILFSSSLTIIQPYKTVYGAGETLLNNLNFEQTVFWRTG